MLALMGVLLTPSISHAETVLPVSQDAWYEAPANLADLPNGSIIRSREVQLRHLAGWKWKVKSYQLLFRTNDRAGVPLATATTVIVPNKRPATGRNLVSYQTAYDGLSEACQPSWSLRTGRVALQGVETLPMSNILSRGWTVVTTDYEGPKNAWGVAGTTAHGVLDGIRAAEAFEPAGLTDGVKTKVGMVGYSGGGNATAWANEYAPNYAPELNIVGAAQGGVGPKLDRVVSALDGQLFAGIAFAGIIGVTSGYPEINLTDYLNDKGKRVYRELTSKRYSCISDFVMKYPFWKFRDLLNGKDRGLLKSPKMLEIAAENSLGRWTPKAPVLWYQTRFDQMNGYWLTREVANGYCKAGHQVWFDSSAKEEHAMQAISRPFWAYDWLSLRFSGSPMKTNCDAIA
ncbi:MAG: hypothetical protein PGN13_10025 [Patulibacter minatonensis]